MALPKFLQATLWSYDLSRIDAGRDKLTIIPQVLNHGDSRDLKWLFSTYSDDEIKEIIRHPRRGVWRRKKLRYWLDRYNLLIDPLEFEAAVIDLINPRIELIKAIYSRLG